MPVMPPPNVGPGQGVAPGMGAGGAPPSPDLPGQSVSGGVTPPVGGGLPARAEPVGKNQAALSNVALGVGFLMMGLRDLDAGSDLGLSIHKFINEIRKQIPNQETVSGDAQKLLALRQKSNMRPGMVGGMPGGSPVGGGVPPGMGPAAGASPSGPPPVPSGPM